MVSVVLRFLRDWFSEISLWVRLRTPFERGFGVLLDCVKSSDVRLFFAFVVAVVDVAPGAGVCSSGVCVPFMDVLLSSEPLDICGEPESVEVRLRLAGRSSSKSEGASWNCATSLRELRRLPELALDGPADVVFAPRLVVIENGGNPCNGSRREGAPAVVATRLLRACPDVNLAFSLSLFRTVPS